MNTRIRTFGSVLLIAIFGLSATGCGTTPVASTKTVQIRVWRLGQAVDPLKTDIAAFQKQYKTATVTYFNKNNVDTYENAALRSMASKTGPDIWSIPDDWIGDESSVVAPVPDDFFKDPAATCPNTKDASVNPACLGAVAAAKALYPDGIYQQILSNDGKSLLGVPTNADALHLYVNSDMLNTAYLEFRASQPKGTPDSVIAPVRVLLSQPPATWNDLVAQTKYLTVRSGTNITRSAIAMGSADNIPNSADILQLLMLQNNVPIVGSDRTRTLIEETVTTASGTTARPGQNALEFYTSFANPTKDTYTWNTSMPSALDAFGQGKVAMVIGYTNFGNQLKAKYPKSHPAVTSVPQVSLTNPAVNLISFSVETVARNADTLKGAFLFLGSYTDKITTASLASDLKLRSPYTDVLMKKPDDYFNQQVLTGQAIFKKDRTAFDASFRQMITDVVQNGVTSSAAVDTGAQTLNGLLNGSADQN